MNKNKKNDYIYNHYRLSNKMSKEFGTTIDYTDNILRCGICGCVEESDGAICKINNCSHTFHINCISHYCANNKKMLCPECDIKFYDRRLHLAISFILQDRK